MPFSTTIKKIYWDMKMEDQESEGYFIEYKDMTDHWKPRIEKAKAEINEKGYTRGTFLVGNIVHRVVVHDIEKVVRAFLPTRYGSALKGDICYAIKCEAINESP